MKPARKRSRRTADGAMVMSKRLFHFGLRVGQGWRPTLQDLRDTYGCSRATAYRLHALVREVDGQSHPVQATIIQ